MAKPRDYAKERANRDAKYQALGYKSYNQYDTERRRNKANKAGFKTYGRMVARQKKAQQLAERIGEYLDERELDFDSDYWDMFRQMYDRGAITA